MLATAVLKVVICAVAMLWTLAILAAAEYSARFWLALLDCSTPTFVLSVRMFIFYDDFAVCSEVMLGIVLAMLVKRAYVVIWRETKLLATLVLTRCL